MTDKLKLFVLLFILVVAIGKISAQETIGHISGTVRIELKNDKISAKLKYKYIAFEENEPLLKLYLNGNFTVGKVKCKVCKSFEFDKKSERLPVLKIQTTRRLSKGENILLDIEYTGNLEEMFNREHRFLELGLDYFWYPVHPKIGETLFTYNLDVMTDEPEFEMVGNGRIVKKGKNRRIISKRPDLDINIVISDKFKTKTFPEKGYDLRVVSKDLPENVSAELLDSTVKTLEFYNTTFGRNNPQTDVTGVFRPFDLDFGYFRKGFFVLNSPKTAAEQFTSIAHELAHFWWSKANRQNAWLDESFAETCALLALRKIKGDEKFNAEIERKKKLSVNLPPIYGFDRDKNPRQTPLVLYVKGPLKLLELEKDLGAENFLQFLAVIDKEKIIETDRLIERIRTFSTNEIAEKFLANLKE